MLWDYMFWWAILLSTWVISCMSKTIHSLGTNSRLEQIHEITVKPTVDKQMSGTCLSCPIKLQWLVSYVIYFFVLWFCSPAWAMASSSTRFLDHTQWRTTVCKTHLDEWSARHRDLYLTTYNIHNRQTSMPLVGFEPTVPARKSPQTRALDCMATGIGVCVI